MSALADLEIVVTGCVIVMAVLALLWGLTAGVGRLVVLGHGANHRRLKASAGEAAAGIPVHHLVAIAAAVEAVIGEPHRIVAISAPAHRVPAWASTGRHRRPDHRPSGNGLPNKRTDAS